ncbi:hypothetical protein BCF53_102385 [Reinekea marinisedimentorum]|uniref:Acetyltransferase (GNAT) family protein n=1 Tax=Reinekea marinisedimentorum TaxID=230495 RepID=A0A4R3IA91_9GAMM|nr:hypothetical protein BCF53_102385 [Reinekea marinisedimentorum]
MERSLGKRVMVELHRIDAVENRYVTLTRFKSNERALNMYRSLGYDVIEENSHFLVFRTPHSNIERVAPGNKI